MKKTWFAFAAASVLACSDPFTVSLDSVAGLYEATTLTQTGGGETTDFLALGGSLTLTLNPDGTVSGRLFIPEAGVGGADFDEDMTGTWEVSTNTVTFDQAADTFIRDMEFVASERRLTAQRVFGLSTWRVELTRIPSIPVEGVITK